MGFSLHPMKIHREKDSLLFTMVELVKLNPSTCTVQVSYLSRDTTPVYITGYNKYNEVVFSYSTASILKLDDVTMLDRYKSNQCVALTLTTKELAEMPVIE